MNRRERRAAAALRRASAPASVQRQHVDAGIERARAAQAAATGQMLDDEGAPLRVVQACARSHVFSQALGQELIGNENRIACKEGCAWCCHLRVSSTPLEVLGIAEWLRSQLTEDELAGVRERARSLANETAGMTWTERPPRRCPLLVDDRCRAYQARPLMCRGWHSFDVTPCRAFVEGDGHAAADVSVRLLMLFQGLLGGLQDAAGERRLESATVDFAVALSVTLESPDTMARWLEGETVFERARIPPNEPSPLKRLNVVQ